MSEPEYRPGLADVPAAESAVSFIDGKRARLEYRGIAVEVWRGRARSRKRRGCSSRARCRRRSSLPILTMPFAAIASCPTSSSICSKICRKMAIR